MTLVKVCGIRTPEAALKAAESGASLIGLIFAKSKRQITPEQGSEIVRALKSHHSASSSSPGLQSREEFRRSHQDPTANWFQEWCQELEAASKHRPLVVGVFLNQTPEEINQVVATASLDLVQLHGDEPIDDADKICVPVVRALHVGEGDSAESVKAQIIPGHYAFVLLDSKVTGASQQGGSGIPFDWNVAHSLRRDCPFLVAGGLTPDNVEEAIRKIGPWGVDVSSGVEVDGQKDLTKIENFVRRGRAVTYAE